MRYISDIFLKEGIEKLNKKDFYFALTDKENNILSKGEIINSPFYIEDSILTIEGYSGNCEYVSDGKSNYLSLFSDEDIVYSCEIIEQITNKKYKFVVGNIKIKFEGIK